MVTSSDIEVEIVFKAGSGGRFKLMVGCGPI
jgi:hypothetical protein